jgi:PrtD family type I secretion system ABC transporter
VIDPPDVRSALREALRQSRTPLAFAGLFSLASNLLYLALPLYTNLVYARVLPGGSGSTLLVLTFGVMFVFVISSALDALRARVLIDYGIRLDDIVSRRVFETLFDAALQRDSAVGRSQSLRDLDLLRQSFTGSAVNVLFDVPWIPIFLLVLFLVDPWIGLITTMGGLILLALAYAQDRATRSTLRGGNDAALQSYAFTESALRNRQVVQAMGMLPAITRLWGGHRLQTIDRSALAGERSAWFGSAIRLVRLFVQILIIAVGAYLIIADQIPSGMLFANMILSARALAPIERLVGSYNTLVNAGQAYERLNKLDTPPSAASSSIQLPRPTGALRVERASFAGAGTGGLLVNQVSFELSPGQTLGVIGPSGAGKSTLTRLLTGVWRPISGTVRLDGADVSQWDRESFGRYVGYLPQDVELFAGTVRDNIGRFQENVSDEDVAGAHELILRLPRGYETEVGDGGASLSAGQRQRVGLARALFGDPAMVILDEPNAALDAEGEDALRAALTELKRRGVTIVIVSHKANVFRTADRMLLMRDGRVEMFGPREDVMGRFAKPQPTPALEAAD